MWQAPCCHHLVIQASQQYSKVGTILLWKLKTLDGRNWPDMSCSKGSSCLALYAQRLPGVYRQEPRLEGTSLSFTRISWKGLQAPHGYQGSPLLWSRALTRGSWKKALWLHPQCQQHLALSSVSRAFRSTNPFLSYLLWPEGLQCCPLELLWAQCWPVTT